MAVEDIRRSCYTHTNHPIPVTPSFLTLPAVAKVTTFVTGSPHEYGPSGISYIVAPYVGGVYESRNLDLVDKTAVSEVGSDKLHYVNPYFPFSQKAY